MLLGFAPLQDGRAGTRADVPPSRFRVLVWAMALTFSLIGNAMARDADIPMPPAGRDVRSDDPRLESEEDMLTRKLMKSILSGDMQGAADLHRQLKERFNWRPPQAAPIAPHAPRPTGGPGGLVLPPEAR